MSDINWQAKSQVLEDVETGDTYVRVNGGVMLAEDYAREGGRVEDPASMPLLVFRRYMSNVELQQEFG